MPRLLRLAISTGLVAAWSVVGAAASASPGGRVERVERAGGAWTAPRLCEIHGDNGNCVGEAPRPGQTAIVLDEHRAAVQVEVVEVNSSSGGCDNFWTIKTRLVRRPGADATEIDGLGVIDPGVSAARSRLVDKTRLPGSPSGQAGEDVWRAIDRDGDGVADIIITRYSCDASGKLTSGSASFCIDVWARTGPKLVRTTQLNFAQCNL